MESFRQLALTRQACRDFNDKPLEESVVEEIARTAMLAPSACNSQPWKMCLVTSPDKVKEVGHCLQDRNFNRFLSKAKAYIALVEKEPRLKEHAEKVLGKSFFVKYDIGELAAYITLSAQDIGVSSCIIGWVDKGRLKTALGLEEKEICNIVVALGYSDCEIRKKTRKDEKDVIVKK